MIMIEPRIGRHHDEDDERRYGPDQVPSVREFRGQQVRDGDRVRLITKFLDAPRHDPPRQADTDDLANHDPVGLGADEIAHPRQTEQQPAGLAGSIGAERDDPVGQLLAREVETGQRMRLATAPDREREQDAEIDDEYGDGRGHRGVPTWRASLWASQAGR